MTEYELLLIQDQLQVEFKELGSKLQVMDRGDFIRVEISDGRGEVPFRTVELVRKAAHRELEVRDLVSGARTGTAAWVNGTVYISFWRG